MGKLTKEAKALGKRGGLSRASKLSKPQRVAIAKKGGRSGGVGRKKKG
jgi:hypothetical protein